MNDKAKDGIFNAAIVESFKLTNANNHEDVKHDDSKVTLHINPWCEQKPNGLLPRNGW